MNILPPTDTAIQQACALLKVGQLIGLPTETVYGLAGDATQDQAIARIFAVKNRPTFNPLIIHVSTLDKALELGQFHEKALILAERFWPGPLTLVVAKRPFSPISLLASAGLETIAIRIPSHPVAQQVLQSYGPLAAPSANQSESLSPTCTNHVIQSLGEAVPLILEGGPCIIGLESTILDCTHEMITLLRPGGIAVEEIEAVIGPVLKELKDSRIKAPGMLHRHYAPKLPIRLNALEKHPGEGLLGFGYSPNADLNLSPQGDLIEAAANLFAMLHRLDNPVYTGIAVAPIPNNGLGLAINDRLYRAAASPTG